MDDRLHVLIAEDETLIRLDLRQLLEAEGLAVCAEARDGVEAVELARETQPDAAILDMKMPNLDGIEAARRIYAERPIPIVMLTAYADPAPTSSRRSAPRWPGTRSCSSHDASGDRVERRSRSRCVRAPERCTRCACAGGLTGP